MKNQHIAQRLAGIQAILMGVYQAGASLSSATKGAEREAFVERFLSQVLTPQYRFGTGDATDQQGRRSGQLDVVVEYPWVPSLPIVQVDQSRLYLAEGTAAVIEVKSNIASQWSEVLHVAQQLEPLRRTYGSGMSSGSEPMQRIPLFAVGYSGWKTPETVQRHLNGVSVDGILIIDAAIFVSSPHFLGMTATGPWALWGLIACLHRATSVLSSRATDVPFRYVTE